MPKPIDVALLGVGHVGRAVLDRLATSEHPVRIVAATDTQGTVLCPDGLDPATLAETKRTRRSVTALPDGGGRDATTCPPTEHGVTCPDWRAVEAAERVDADVVVQLTPTDVDDPARSLAALEAALAGGAHVVTAAKDALACHPAAVREAADAADRRVLASAAVGAGVPVLETIETAFRGDEVERLEAVLNGSTTFVLSQMEAGLQREAALAKAREAGLLEADPTVDLSGRDAAAKAALLHQRLFGSELALDEVTVQGIGHVDEHACRQARQRGFAIRLLARIDAEGARVGPVEIDREGPLAVDGPTCCVRWTLDGAGEVTLTGPGAGPRETASAVVSDVLRLTQAPGGPADRHAARPAILG